MDAFGFHLHDFYVLGDPTNDPNIYGDPFKTLFVARIVRIFSFTLIQRMFNCCNNVCFMCLSFILSVLK